MNINPRVLATAFALTGLTGLAACGATRPDVVETRGVAVRSPDGARVADIWENVPSSAEVRGAYPELAKMSGTPGGAALRCRVGEAGELVQCGVVPGSERPPGYGFGEAALRLVSSYRVRLGAHGPKPGDLVGVPVQFEAER